QPVNAAPGRRDGPQADARLQVLPDPQRRPLAPVGADRRIQPRRPGIPEGVNDLLCPMKSAEVIVPSPSGRGWGEGVPGPRPRPARADQYYRTSFHWWMFHSNVASCTTGPTPTTAEVAARGLP